MTEERFVLTDRQWALMEPHYGLRAPAVRGVICRNGDYEITVLQKMTAVVIQTPSPEPVYFTLAAQPVDRLLQQR